MNKKTDNNSFSILVSQKGNKLLGTYPQKQNGLFMQRIKILGGRINWTQWRKIAHLAETYSKGVPLHITTRQDIELHNLHREDIHVIYNSLEKASLTTFGAGGDSVRNITICPSCDLCKNGLDLLPLAEIIQQHLEKDTAILNLPRKFKISFSGCEKACAKPWINDLGFIAGENNLFNVVGAGSLGARPESGIMLYKKLPPEEILPFCVAAINMFNRYGDRVNRHRARFRHVRTKLGDEKFKEELHAYLTQVKVHQNYPKVLLPSSSNKKVRLLYRLQLPNGNISPQQANTLAEAAEHADAILRLNLEHGLEIYGKRDFQLPEGLDEFINNPIIVACPGSTSCSKALINCQSTAEKIRKTLSKKQLSNFRINISGCPNNCAQSAIADIGLIGTLRKISGKQTHCYRFFQGGGNGRNNKLAEPLDVVADENVSDTIKEILKQDELQKNKSP